MTAPLVPGLADLLTGNDDLASSCAWAPTDVQPSARDLPGYPHAEHMPELPPGGTTDALARNFAGIFGAGS